MNQAQALSHFPQPATLQIIDQFVASKNILGTQSDDNISDISREESDLEELFTENSDEQQLSNNEIGDTLSQDITNNSSPLLGNLRTDLGGLFYNIEDTLPVSYTHLTLPTKA